MVLAVFKMNDNSLESNGAIPDFHLYGPEPAAGCHMNVIVISPAIHVSLSEIFPSSFVSVTTPLGV
jgi:hypothetical protein